jgi:tungstate transport system substrate-binding protein
MERLGQHGQGVRQSLLCAAIPARAEQNPGQEMTVNQPDLMLACTIGPIDAGIIGELEKAYTCKTRVVIAHVGAGTGKALERPGAAISMS